MPVKKHVVAFQIIGRGISAKMLNFVFDRVDFLENVLLPAI